MMRLLSRLLYLMLVSVALDLAPAPAIAQSQTETCTQRLCVGVRSDARPFSYRTGGDARTDATSGPLSAAGYSGYMVRICDAVLQQLILDGDLTAGEIGLVDIDTGMTEALKRHRTDGTLRLDLLGREFDILCDPATITNTRRNDFVVSPPLYLTGISFLKSSSISLPNDICGMFRKTKANKQQVGLIGVVGGTTAASEGVEALVASGVLPALERDLNSYLAGRSICEGAVQPEQVVLSFPTHREAAEAFCGKNSQTTFLYYLGDLEIITANAASIRGCQPEAAKETYTNDRYAIFAKSDWGNYPDKAQLVARFFELLTQKVVFSPSLLDKAFEDTFIGQNPSPKLKVFFWSIRGEQR